MRTILQALKVILNNLFNPADTEESNASALSEEAIAEEEAAANDDDAVSLEGSVIDLDSIDTCFDAIMRVFKRIQEHVAMRHLQLNPQGDCAAELSDSKDSSLQIIFASSLDYRDSVIK